MTRVLILGGGGMLGHKLSQVFGRRFDTFVSFRGAAPEVPGVFDGIHPIPQVDALSTDSLEGAFAAAEPDVVVNAIGVVKQVAAAGDPILSITLNSLLPHRLMDRCEANGARLIHISTDCVFSGRRGNYAETDPPDPVDLYGRSKLLGEVDGERALTVRTSIVGRELSSRHGLVEWLLAQRGGRVKGYTRAIFSGLSTAALAAVLAELVARPSRLRGVWHVSSVPISKYELLVRLDEAFAARVSIEPDADLVCDRTLNSDRFWRTTGLPRPEWAGMVEQLAADPTPYGGKIAARA